MYNLKRIYITKVNFP